MAERTRRPRVLAALLLLAASACGADTGSARGEESARGDESARGGESARGDGSARGEDNASGDTARAAPSHAVILLYHHVADDTPASTSVTPATFRAHLQYLDEHGYQVVPLSELVAWQRGRGAPPPANAVAITFDDAYASVHEQAAPLLERFGYPYAVFVSTGYIDQGFGNYMTWDQLRELEAGGAEIANHSQTHDHYLHRREGESERDWRQRIADDIRGAQARLDAELEAPLDALAYPYGEFSPDLTALAAELGFTAFGQQSGPVGPQSGRQTLPRFPMASRYADIEGLAEKLATRPFRVTVESGVGPVLEAGAEPPTLALHLEAPGARLPALSCFVSGQEPPRLEWADQDAGRVRVTARQSLPVGRSKYTCTAPAADGDAYYWYSHLWMVRPAGGGWYSD